MEQLQQQIDEMKVQIAVLQSQLASNNNGSFDEKIRDIVFFDVDNTTVTTQTATTSGGQTVTVGKIPTKFLRGYFRGQVFNFPINSI
jgi:hypothetical protein